MEVKFRQACAIANQNHSVLACIDHVDIFNQVRTVALLEVCIDMEGGYERGSVPGETINLQS